MYLLCLSAMLSAALILTTPLHSQVFTRIADQNTPVPGGLDGETLSTFIEEGVPWVSDRCIVFRGAGDRGTEGLYLVRNGMIEIVADINTPVPGGDGQNFLEFEESFALDACDVVFDGVGDGADARRGVYLKREGMPLEVVVDTTFAAPAGGTFSDFENPWLEGDVVVFVAETVGGGCASRSIYKTTESGLAVVVDTCGGTPVPDGMPGETFATPLDTLPILEDDVLTFTAKGDMATYGVYAEIEGSLLAIADTATPIPGGGGALFSKFIEYVPTSDGDIVFGGAGEEEEKPFTHAGLYSPTPGGIVTVFDLVDPPLPGWDPADPITEFGFWFCGNDRITLGVAGMTSSEAIFLIQGSKVSRLVTAGDSLDGARVHRAVPVRPV